MVFHSIFPKNEIEKEKNVVIEELNKDYDDASRHVHELIMPKLFLKHPLGNCTIGTKKSINSISREDVIEYYNRYYNPNNMYLSICGNFNES